MEFRSSEQTHVVVVPPFKKGLNRGLNFLDVARKHEIIFEDETMLAFVRRFYKMADDVQMVLGGAQIGVHHVVSRHLFFGGLVMVDAV